MVSSVLLLSRFCVFVVVLRAPIFCRGTWILPLARVSNTGWGPHLDARVRLCLWYYSLSQRMGKFREIPFGLRRDSFSFGSSYVSHRVPVDTCGPVAQRGGKGEVVPCYTTSYLHQRVFSSPIPHSFFHGLAVDFHLSVEGVWGGYPGHFLGFYPSWVRQGLFLQAPSRGVHVRPFLHFLRGSKFLFFVLYFRHVSGVLFSIGPRASWAFFVDYRHSYPWE